jgi:hypothetical protein
VAAREDDLGGGAGWPGLGVAPDISAAGCPIALHLCSRDRHAVPRAVEFGD